MAEMLELMNDWAGYRGLHESRRTAGSARKMKETIDLLTNAAGMPRHRHEYEVREALTTSDFPYLFGDVLDSQVLARYKAVEPAWKAFTKIGKVNRIYPQVGAYRYAITGGDQYLPEVAEKGEYLASERNEERYSIYVKKYGKQFDISWETRINDILDALGDTPARFADAALRTEHRLVTSSYAGDVGTHTANANLFEVGVNASANAFNVANLAAALEAMDGWTDDNGEPIMASAKYLVYPPALHNDVMQVLNSTNVMWVYRGDDEGGPTQLGTTNTIQDYNLVPIKDKYLPVLDATSGDLGWYLFADPNDIAAIEASYLSGHENPEICMKASDKVSVGGGELGPMSGDFATDNIFYRVRHVFGANKLDWRACYMGGYQG